MSGVESAVPSFEWELTLGNVVTWVGIILPVGGAIYGIFRAFKQGITNAVLTQSKEIKDTNAKIDTLLNKIEDHEVTTEQHLDRNLERINELKSMIDMIDRRINEVKIDVNKRIDEREREIEELVKMLQRFQNELHALVLDVERRIRAANTEERREDRRFLEMKRTEDKAERQTEQSEERRIDHGAERRRERYEGDTGRVPMTEQEKMRDPASAHEERRYYESQEEEREGE